MAVVQYKDTPNGRPVQLQVRGTGPLLKTIGNRPRQEHDAMTRRTQKAKSSPQVVPVDLCDDEDDDDVNKSPESSELDDGDGPVAAVDIPPPSRKTTTNSALKKLERLPIDAPQSNEAGTASNNPPLKRAGVMPRRSTRDFKGQAKEEAGSPSKRRKTEDGAMMFVENNFNMFDDFSSQSHSSQRSSQNYSTRNRPRPANIHSKQTDKDTRSSQSNLQEHKQFKIPSTPVEPAAQAKPGLQVPAAFEDLKTTLPQQKDLHTTIDPAALEDEDLGDYFLDKTNSSRELTPVPDDATLNETQEHLRFIAASKSTSSHIPDGLLARCPACNAITSLDLVQQCTPRKHLRWKDKLDICTAHKLASARATWAKEQYPSIDWNRLPQRIERFRPNIVAILEGKRESYYHNELEERLSSSNGANVHNSLRAQRDATKEALVPGYYGPRGAQVILTSLVSGFLTKVRGMAKTDKVMRSVGAMGYLQAVLVPEIATVVIMDDMQVDEEGAREVLKTSAEVGSLLSSELKETEEKEKGGDKRSTQAVKGRRRTAEIVDLV